MYVATGTHVYTVADLSQVGQLDAYDPTCLDPLWTGGHVHCRAHPGEVFQAGSASSRDAGPEIQNGESPCQRADSDERLKPEMFVRAVVESHLAQEGKVMDPNLAGKWTCPMHPSVVKGQGGTCDVCGMDLATTESLGFVTAQSTGVLPLVIPASAPLITGQRAVVYVKKPDTENPTFEGRQIVLGPRAGDYYIVKDGLAEGERVVTNGSFKIDSALQIQAKPSMMNPEGGSMPAGHRHEMEKSTPADSH
jgi:Cu(I)/Ag(I) efflux system membrane fusion protein